jgi:hypothetical protein
MTLTVKKATMTPAPTMTTRATTSGMMAETKAGALTETTLEVIGMMTGTMAMISTIKKAGTMTRTTRRITT